jgi:dienelactone hydrolase
MKRTTSSICLVVLMTSGHVAGQRADQTVAFSTGLPFGPHSVGFHREWTLDASRVWEKSPSWGSNSGPVSRPIRVDVWFPAAATQSCKRTTLDTYLHASAPDSYFAAANGFIEGWDQASYAGLAKGESISVERVLSLTSHACLDGQPEQGPFPLVVYSGGWYNRSPDNVALAEYLASHGYVFAAVPLLGAGLWTRDLSSNSAAVETQVRDLEATIGFLISHTWVDRNRIGVIGYSTGGIVAILAGARHRLIDAVVGLDPSYGGEPKKVLTSPAFNVDKFSKPLLTLRSGNEIFTSRPRSALIAALKSADQVGAVALRGSSLSLPGVQAVRPY